MRFSPVKKLMRILMRMSSSHLNLRLLRCDRHILKLGNVHTVQCICGTLSGPSPIAIHGPISGPKDLYRAVDRYRARSYRSKRLELRFAVAVHSPLAVHGPITVQPEFFKFPRRNVPLGISLSTDFSAFSSFRRETCESTSLSALIFVPFQEQTKVWRGLPGIFVRCVVLFFFLFFLFDTVRCLFKRRREKVWRGTPWFKESNTHRETNLFSKCQLIAVRTRSLGGLSPRSVCS